jgi:hypothetical protein
MEKRKHIMNNINRTEEQLDWVGESTTTPALTTTASLDIAAPDETVAQAAPSIASSALLVELNMGQWTARKKDKKATAKANQDAGARRDASSVNKNLLTGCDSLAAITKFNSRLRSTHYELSLDWASGVKLLPTALHQKYHETMTGLIAEGERLVDTFLEEYEFHKIAAEANLGDMYDANEYPSVEQVRRKFYYSIVYSPVPESGDFRVDMGNTAQTYLVDSYNKHYQDRIQTAANTVWQRMYDVLEAMSERLDGVDVGKNGEPKNKQFQRSLISNVTDLVDLMGAFNVTGDSQMTALQQRLDSAMRGVTFEALKCNPHLRAQTKREVDAVLAQLPSLDM